MADQTYKSPTRFHYRDMICKVVEITQSECGDLVLQVILPYGSNAKRYLTECERIPEDLLFIELIAEYYRLTVTKVTPIFSLDENTEKATLLMRCRYSSCRSFSDSLRKSHGMFCEIPRSGSNVVFEYSFPFTITGIYSRDENMKVDGQYLMSLRVHTTVEAYSMAHSDYLMEFNITCLNIDDVMMACPDYSIRFHSAIYRQINNQLGMAIDRIKSEILCLDSSYELQYKFMVFNLDSDMMIRTNFTLHILAMVKSLCGYEIIIHDSLSVGFSPSREGKDAGSLTDKYGFIDPLIFNYYISPLMARIMTTQDSVFLPTATVICETDNDGRRFWDATFEPAYVTFTPGTIHAENNELAQMYFKTNETFYLIQDWIDNVQMAFPVIGNNPMLGAICYGRFDHTKCHIQDIADQFSDTQYLEIRVLCKVKPYTYFAVVSRGDEEVLIHTVSGRQGLLIDQLPEAVYNSTYRSSDPQGDPFSELASSLISCKNYNSFNRAMHDKFDSDMYGFGQAVRAWTSVVGLHERPFYPLLEQRFEILLKMQQNDPSKHGAAMTYVVNRDESEECEEEPTKPSESEPTSQSSRSDDGIAVPKIESGPRNGILSRISKYFTR